jgi:hypothetical protein
MGNAPAGAMSSPYCQGGEFSEMIKNSNYFKDATFNTEQKPEIKKSEFLETGKILEQEKAKIQEIVFQPGIKNEFLKLLMKIDLEVVSVSDSLIEFKFQEHVLRIYPQ